MSVDLVQLNQPALAADANFPVPVIAVSHSCLATWWQAVERAPVPEDFAWRIALHAAGLRAAHRVVTPSAAFAAATQLAYGLSERPLAVHNGRAALPQSKAAMHDFAFTAGRLWDRAKDLATLDRAAARLGLPVKAAGPVEGPHGERLASSHLHLLGRMSEQSLAGCLAARPAFVSAAKYEPFGLAVLEAAAAGCPLILSDIPTFRELWDGAAIFVDVGDDRSFASAIEEVIGDTALRLSLGEKARATALRFTPERMAANMMSVYQGLLAAPLSGGMAA